MNIETICFIFSLLIISLFSLNFNKKWSSSNYEKLKNKNSTWFWFRIFKINENKENFVRFYKSLSIFVIIIMLIPIILFIIKQIKF